MPTIFGRVTHISIAIAALMGITCLHAQSFPVTAAQKATATKTAEAGIPLADLKANAPDSYTVKRGDTLWMISGLFLKSPWRWPELWGMNQEDIKNPNLIFPGQQLFLDKSNGRATLRTSANGGPPELVHVSPRTRFESLKESSIPTLNLSAIEPFLSEALIVDEATFLQAPRLVAAQEGRVLLSRGDRAYARGTYSTTTSTAGLVSISKPLSEAKGDPFHYQVFRNATPLKDPATQKILGYEAHYLGKADLVRGESTAEVIDKDGKKQIDIVPATFDIMRAKEEIRVGDRLLPEPTRQLLSFSPHAPATPINGQIVSVYGNDATYAGRDQVVVINKGASDGIELGHVMVILKSGATLADKTDAAAPNLQIPDERNGLLIVFRTFEKLSYALVLQITDGVKVGDKFANPK